MDGSVWRGCLALMLMWSIRGALCLAWRVRKVPKGIVEELTCVVPDEHGIEGARWSFWATASAMGGLQATLSELGWSTSAGRHEHDGDWEGETFA